MNGEARAWRGGPRTRRAGYRYGRQVESRLQRFCLGAFLPGALPQARMNKPFGLLMCAPKAQCHSSLGQRPRVRTSQEQSAEGAIHCHAS